MTSRWTRSAVVGLATALALAGVACNNSGGSSRNEGDVSVALKDFSLTVEPDTVPAGSVDLVATNDGPSIHEFEVFSVGEGVDPEALPVEQDVAITDGLTLVDELEDVVPGSTATLTVDLAPGTYAIMCNLPEHYAQGMVASLTVE